MTIQTVFYQQPCSHHTSLFLNKNIPLDDNKNCVLPATLFTPHLSLSEQKIFLLMTIKMHHPATALNSSYGCERKFSFSLCS